VDVPLLAPLDDVSHHLGPHPFPPAFVSIEDKKNGT
jgi:hypothetical protein